MEALESKTYTTEKTLAERMNERLAELHMTKAEAAMRMKASCRAGACRTSGVLVPVMHQPIPEAYHLSGEKEDQVHFIH